MNCVSFLLACFLIIGRNEIIITGFVASSSSPLLLPSLSLSPPSPLLMQIGKSSALFETKYDEEYYSHVPAQQASRSRITLSRFLQDYIKDDHPELQDLQNILLAVQMACKTISSLINRAGLVYAIQHTNETYTSDNCDGEDDDNDGVDGGGSSFKSDGRYYSMKRLDKLSTTVLKSALKFTGTVSVAGEAKEILNNKKELQSSPDQHHPDILIANDAYNLAILDPLDGSGNADASIVTGTVFGVFEKKSKSSAVDEERNDGDVETDNNNDDIDAVLQPGRKMKAAGYCLYSSATVLVFTLGSSVYGFTLDPQIQEFVLTHDKLTIPQRGNVYSCNEANSEGWDKNWSRYLKKLKLGQGETQQRYALRYVGSMVGDIHRTLLYGGVFAYPADRLHKPQGNLQLLYKSSPLAFVMHHAGGKAIDESGNNLLDKCPERIHQKTPCFMGSPGDILELKKYLI